MLNRKEFLKKEIEAYRFRPISEEVFLLYEEYHSLCSDDGDIYQILNLDFHRGEAYFRLGDYEKAQEILNNCLLNNSQDTPPDIAIKCHTVLGLIYSAMGYQMVALENYLSGLDSCAKSENSRQKTALQINIGWLYRDLGDYEKALFYYYQSLKEFTYEELSSFYNLKILCYSYIGQIYFKTGRYKEALDILTIIENLLQASPTSYYYVSISNLRIRAYHYLKQEDKIDGIMAEVIKHAKNSEDFLEFSEDFLDICHYILDFSPKYSRLLIDVLRRNIQKVSLPFLMLALQKLEVVYQKNYSDKASYLTACGEYFTAQQHYDIINRKSKLKSLNNIEVLRKVQQECQIYLEQSKMDLMTGLLNKSTFEQTVSSILQQKSNSSSNNFAFAIIDLDHFKSINDTFGHMEGDKALLEIVRFLNDAFEGSAILGRIGGDEFGVFWPFIDSIDDVYSQTSQMQLSFIRHCQNSDDILCNASISIGIMHSTESITSYLTLFQRADCQLYKAKAAGRATIALEKF